MLTTQSGPAGSDSGSGSSSGALGGGIVPSTDKATTAAQAATEAAKKKAAELEEYQKSKNRLNLTKTICFFAKFETFANPHYFVHRDAKNCGMGPGPWLRIRERKTLNGHTEGGITIPLGTTKAKQSTQNEA